MNVATVRHLWLNRTDMFGQCSIIELLLTSESCALKLTPDCRFIKIYYIKQLNYNIDIIHKGWHLSLYIFNSFYTVVQKNAPTLADYNYDPVQSILIIFIKLFVNDHKSCLVVKFSTSPHICCHYTLWNTMLYFALITLLIAKNAPTSDHHITSISVKEF